MLASRTTIRGGAAALVVIVSLAVVPSARGIVWSVDWAGGGDFLTIGEAMETAADGDTILVEPGTYSGELNRDIDFAGRWIAVLSTGGSGLTTIDCEAEGRAFLLVTGEWPFVPIEGFTIEHGHASYDTTYTDYDGFGGGIVTYQSSVALRDVIFRSCTADDGGGALALRAGAGTSIIECAFEGNSSRDGGALQSEYTTTISIHGCVFEDNVSDNWGGAIFSGYGPTSLTGCVFVDNQSDMGGAINYRGNNWHYLTDCDFLRNTALHHGGALSCYQPHPVFTDCTFAGTDAGYYGAAVGLTIHAGDFTGCTFFGNYVRDHSGAVVATSRASTFTNCTFAFNETPDGGAIVCSGEAAPTVTDCIIAFTGQGVGVLCADSSAPTITNSCVFGNALGDSLCGIYHDNTFADPAFCDTTGGALWLQDCSPCIGAGQSGGTIGAWGVGCPCNDLTGTADLVEQSSRLSAAAVSPSPEGIAVSYVTPQGCTNSSVTVYNLAGRCVGRRAFDSLGSGTVTVTWTPERGRLPSGVYFYTLEACGQVARGRTVLLR